MLGIDPRAARVTWTVAFICLALFIVYSVRNTILVIILSVFFAYLLFPLVRVIDRHTPRRLTRTAALAIVFICIVSLVTIGGALIGDRIAQEANRLSDQLPTMLNTANLSQRIPLPNFLEAHRARMVEFISEQLRSSTGHAVPLAQQFGKILMHAASNLIYLILVPILSFLLIKEAPVIEANVRAWLSRSERRFWGSIAEDLSLLLSTYVRALMLLSLATLIVYGLTLSAFGVPYAALLAGLSGLMEIIPVVGPLAAAASILAVCIFGGYEHIWWVLAFIMAYRLFQDYVLGPYLMGQGVKISSLTVILGLMAGEELGGIVGIFLSVPAIAAVKILLVQLEARRSAQRGTPSNRPDAP